MAVSVVGLWVRPRIRTCGFADFWREERDDHRGAGDEGRGLCCCGIVSIMTEVWSRILTQPGGSAVAVEVVDLSIMSLLARTIPFGKRVHPY